MSRDNGEGSGGSRYYVEVLGRGLAILECFAASATQLSLAQISERVGLNRATAFRLLRTLEQDGYVRQDSASKRYSLSLKVLDLQAASLDALEFPQRAQPVLQELNTRLNEAVGMAVPEGRYIRYVAGIRSQRLLSVNVPVGARLPAHAAAMGKVLLATLDDDEVGQLYAGQELAAYTPYTLTDVDQLVASLAEARRQGFAVTDQEGELGMRSAAAPVRSSNGRVAAAIHVTTSSARVSMEQLVEEYVPALLDAAARISHLLGYRPSTEFKVPG